MSVKLIAVGLVIALIVGGVFLAGGPDAILNGKDGTGDVPVPDDAPDTPVRLAVTVSPVGLADGCSAANGGADYGPDTPGTATCGIQEAIDGLKRINEGMLKANVGISTEEASGRVSLMPGVFRVTSEVVLAQGLTLEGGGRGSTIIALSADAPAEMLAAMDAIVKIPADANLCTVRDLSIYGDRDEPFWPYEIHGLQILGYNWRPTVEDVEIVNCQGSGIDVRTGNSGDGNAIVFEPIFSGVSIMSCNVSGMTMTYCADDALYSVNVENCSNDGIRYYGGNGKWTDVHVYDNRVGIRISGQPLRLVSCSLDTNKLQGAIVEDFDRSVSPGKVIFDAVLAQGNGREASDPLDACAIQLLGSDAVVQNLIAINKPGMDWQKYSVVEKGSADGNAVIDFGVDPKIAQHCVLIGQHTTLNSIAVPDLPGQSGGGGI